MSSSSSTSSYPQDPQTFLLIQNHAYRPGVFLSANIKNQVKWNSFYKSESAQRTEVFNKIDEARKKFLVEIQTVGLGIQTLAQRNQIKSVHEIFYVADVIILMIEDLLSYYLQQCPDDREIESDWKKMKLLFAELTYKSTESEELLKQALALFKAKFAKACLDPESLEAQFQILKVLVIHPDTKFTQIASLFEERARPKSWNEARKEEIRIYFSLSTLHQAFHMLTAKCQKELTWLDETIPEVIEALGGDQTFENFTLAFDRMRPTLTYTAHTLLHPEKIKEWWGEQRTYFFNVVKQLQTCDLSDSEVLKKLKPIVEEAEIEAKRRFANIKQSIQDLNTHPQGIQTRIQLLQNLHYICHGYFGQALGLLRGVIPAIVHGNVALQRIPHSERQRYLATQLPFRREWRLPEPTTSSSSVNPVVNPNEKINTPSTPKKDKKIKGTKRSERATSTSQKPEVRAEPAEVKEIPPSPPATELMIVSEEPLSFEQKISELRERCYFACRSETTINRDALRQGWWHLDQMAYFTQVVASISQISSVEKLNLYFACATHAAWALEQTLRFRSEEASTFDHNLRIMSRRAGLSSEPEIVRKLFLANHWSRYFHEYLHSWKGYTTISTPPPPVLQRMSDLANNLDPCDKQTFLQEVTEIAEQTAELLDKLVPAKRTDKNVEVPSGSVKIPLENRAKITDKNLQTVQVIKSELNSLTFRSKLPDYHPGLNKLKQAESTFEMLHSTLIQLNNATTYEKFSMWALRGIHLLQNGFAESLATIEYMNTGKRQLRHEIENNGEIEFDLKGLPQIFDHLSQKIRYPIDCTKCGTAGKLVDLCAALARYPHQDLGFVTETPIVEDSWNLPQNGVRLVDIIKELNLLFEEALQDVYLKQVLDHLRKQF